jgi:hypothetical protein
MSMVPIIRLGGKSLAEREAELVEQIKAIDHADSRQGNAAREAEAAEYALTECRRHQRAQLERLILAMVRRLEAKGSPRLVAAEAMGELQDIIGKDAMRRRMEEVH